MEIQVRPLEGHDYRSIVEIINMVEAPWQTSEEEARQEDDDMTTADGTVSHYVAVEGNQGQMVGHGVLRGSESSHRPQPYQLELRVHPDWWRHGAGTLLWQRLQEDLDRLKPSSVRIWVRERYPNALDFAQRRGFSEVSRSGPWALAIADTDLTPFTAFLDRISASGVVLTTLSEERAHDAECLTKLHRLRTAVDADIPVAEPYPVLSLEDFVRETEEESVLADGFFIARRGGEYIGLSCLHRSSTNPRELYQSVTGVKSDCRHQGIGTALKVRGVQFAQARGYENITTYVDSQNAPMSALNQKLGFTGGNDAVLMERHYNVVGEVQS